jgi:hypothetical protein
MTVIESIFTKSVDARLRFEFHENPAHGFVADARSQKDGRADVDSI